MGKYDPAANHTYIKNGAVYRTDNLSRVTDFHGTPTQAPAPRNKDAQRNLPGKQPGEHASHVLAARHGGTGEPPNLVRMDGKVNSRDYAAWERETDHLLQQGKSVHVDGYLAYGKPEPAHPDGFNYPQAIMVTRTSSDPSGATPDVEHTSWTNYDMDTFDQMDNTAWLALADGFPNAMQEEKAVTAGETANPKESHEDADQDGMSL